MKKILVFVVITAMFLFGISLGGSFDNGASSFFEESKSRFEEQITTKNNDYKAHELVPSEYTINKIAHKIDSFVSKKMKNIIKKIAK